VFQLNRKQKGMKNEVSHIKTKETPSIPKSKHQLKKSIE
jgi:hypothetical protein